MTEWYSIFRLKASEWKTISPFHSQFCPQKLKMADSPELLFALEIFSDLELIIDELMVDDDDIIGLSAIGNNNNMSLFVPKKYNKINKYQEEKITWPMLHAAQFK